MEAGLKSAVLTATSGAGTFLQSVTTNNANLSGRVDGYWRVWIKAGSGADYEVCSYIDAAASGCKAITANATAVYESTFTYGATSYGIIIRTKSTHTGVVTVDNVYVGVTPGTVQASLTNYAKGTGVTAPKFCMYQFAGASSTTTCTGTCTEYTDTCATGTIGRAGTGSYQTTFAAGTWANSTPVHCWATCLDRTRNAFGQVSMSSTASGGFVHQTYTTDATTTAVDSYCSVTCWGAAP